METGRTNGSSSRLRNGIVSSLSVLVVAACIVGGIYLYGGSSKGSEDSPHIIIESNFLSDNKEVPVTESSNTTTESSYEINYSQTTDGISETNSATSTEQNFPSTADEITSTAETEEIYETTPTVDGITEENYTPTVETTTENLPSTTEAIILETNLTSTVENLSKSNYSLRARFLKFNISATDENNTEENYPLTTEGLNETNSPPTNEGVTEQNFSSTVEVTEADFSQTTSATEIEENNFTTTEGSLIQSTTERITEEATTEETTENIYSITTEGLTEPIPQSTTQIITLDTPTTEETVEKNSTSASTQTKEIICQTKECVKTASSIISSMNMNAKPCDDFYEFACGGWIKNNPIPDDANMNSKIQLMNHEVMLQIKDILEDVDSTPSTEALWKAQNLYKYCMIDETQEINGIGSIISLFRTLEVNELPFYDETTERERTSTPLGLMIGNAEKNLDDSIFFKFDVIKGSSSSERYYIALQQASFNSLFEDGALNLDERGLAYYMETYIKVYLNHFSSEGKNVKEAVKSMAHFAIRLQKLAAETESEEFEQSSFSNLQRITDNYVVDSNDPKRMWWWDYVKTTHSDINGLSRLGFVAMQAPIFVKKNYFMKVSQLISETSYETIEQYIWWRIFSKVAPFSTSELYAAQKLIIQSASGRRATPKWKDCATYASDVYGLAVGREYVTKHFNMTYRNQLQKMSNNAKLALENTVETLNWMDEKTKQLAISQIRAMNPIIGYPNWIFAWGQLDKYYEKNYIVPGDRFNSLWQVLLSRNSLKMQILSERPFSHVTAQSPANANLNQFLDNNAFMLPASMLRSPFYELGTDALNYGSMGTVISQHLTHGLDYKKQMRELREENAREVTRNVRCFIRQYLGFNTQYAMKESDVNGERDVAEMVADNGGIRNAMRAYELQKASTAPNATILLPGLESYSEKQLLFLSYANPWCRREAPGKQNPSRTRVLASLSNMEEFAEAWKCPAGSRMNPAEKCSIW